MDVFKKLKDNINLIYIKYLRKNNIRHNEKLKTVLLSTLLLD